ncbi:hypothetical protein KQX54_003555 [Cotesia glomerata]|uniref:Uncharacterized protein n=1 Tax=Cotesia glomerata TaxID=32391 RepID=A0AAV7IJ94_COTGL|nr:hypothetical protein KQX54_003555 [Cotesia glomerata]
MSSTSASKVETRRYHYASRNGTRTRSRFIVLIALMINQITKPPRCLLSLAMNVPNMTFNISIVLIVDHKPKLHKHYQGKISTGGYSLMGKFLKRCQGQPIRVDFDPNAKLTFTNPDWVGCGLYCGLRF